jgi:hypothetical protein
MHALLSRSLGVVSACSSDRTVALIIDGVRRREAVPFEATCTITIRQLFPDHERTNGVRRTCYSNTSFRLHPIRVLVLLANVAIVVYLCRRKDVFESQVRRMPLVRS